MSVSPAPGFSVESRAGEVCVGGQFLLGLSPGVRMPGSESLFHPWQAVTQRASDVNFPKPQPPRVCASDTITSPE